MKIQNKELKQVSQKEDLYDIRDLLLKEHNICIGINPNNPKFECFSRNNEKPIKLCDIPILNPCQEKIIYGDFVRDNFDKIVKRTEEAFLYILKNISVIKNTVLTDTYTYDLGQRDVYMFNGLFNLLDRSERQKIYKEVNEFVLGHKRTGLVASIVLWAFNKVILKL
jgi:hypothetical protein